MMADGLPLTENPAMAVRERDRARDGEARREERSRVRYWMYHARHALRFRNHALFQFAAIVLLMVVAAFALARVADYIVGPDICVRGAIRGTEYACALLVPRVPDDFSRLRGLRPATAAPAELRAGAVHVHMIVDVAVDADMLTRSLAAMSQIGPSGPRCMCGADYGLPLRVAAYDGVVMYGARLASTGGAAVFSLRDSPAAAATRFAGEVRGPTSAYVSYDTPAASVEHEMCAGQRLACVVWCDALLIHATSV